MSTPTHNASAIQRNKGSSLEIDLLTYQSDRPPLDIGRIDSPIGKTTSQLIVSMLDLTQLSEQCNAKEIEQLCHDAATPLPSAPNLTVAAVCIPMTFIRQACELRGKSDYQIATVAGHFPKGEGTLSDRCAEVQRAALLGADEIDVVIDRRLAQTQQWSVLYEEVHAFRQAAGTCHLKVILGTGDLNSPDRIYGASMVAMMAGADFIKTSTGRERVNATLEAGWVMASAINDYYHRFGYKVGLKPAGGIRTTADAAGWLKLVETRLGLDWLTPTLFRIGASGLLSDLRNLTSQ